MAFRRWAETDPHQGIGDYGEWASCFPGWTTTYTAIEAALEAVPLAEWSDDAIDSLIALLGSDDELEAIAEILAKNPAVLLQIADRSITHGSSRAKWQLADHLATLHTRHDVAHRLVLSLAVDSDEYVRRRSLGALAKMRSSHTEHFALRAWNEPGEHWPWSRMMCLHALHAVGSPLFVQHCTEAMKSRNQYLAGFAAKLWVDTKQETSLDSSAP